MSKQVPAVNKDEPAVDKPDQDQVEEPVKEPSKEEQPAEDEEGESQKSSDHVDFGDWMEG
jgi:hypothetical protein